MTLILYTLLSMALAAFAAKAGLLLAGPFTMAMGGASLPGMALWNRGVAAKSRTFQGIALLVNLLVQGTLSVLFLLGLSAGALWLFVKAPELVRWPIWCAVLWLSIAPASGTLSAIYANPSPDQTINVLTLKLVRAVVIVLFFVVVFFPAPLLHRAAPWLPL